MHGALYGDRYRVIVTTDIGGSDPDDFQSMVHYLLYSDLFDTEGLISAPWGEGRKSDILTVIDRYAEDYPALRRYSDRYPEPAALLAMTFQGAVDLAPYKGYSEPTEASEWIIRCARRPDPRPLYLLMWGLLEDLAQALHDAPDILPKLRVHYIGGPNKKWGPNAYAYIRENFPDLWMIENNSTYRGWFNGGDMEGDLGNHGFVTAHAAGHGALGDYFTTHLGGTIKMGDTPTVAWLLAGDPGHPEAEGWGGSFTRVTDMPYAEYEEPLDRAEVEAFGLLEIRLRGPVIDPTEAPVFELETGGQRFYGYYIGAGEYRIRFVPKEVGRFPYVIHSPIPELEGRRGEFIAVPETAAARHTSGGNLTHWWSDRLGDADAEGAHRGAKTVNRWRRDYLRSFAERFARCLPEANTM